jgi:hypothetical protein
MRRSAQFQFEFGGDGALQQSAVDGALEEMLALLSPKRAGYCNSFSFL